MSRLTDLKYLFGDITSPFVQKFIPRREINSSNLIQFSNFILLQFVVYRMIRVYFCWIPTREVRVFE